MCRIEAAVRNGLTNPFCTSTANQWLPNQKDVQPMKVKDINFGQPGKKNDHLCRHQRKYNPLSEQGDMKMLISTDFAEGLKDVCPESIWFSAVSKPDVDFVKQQTDEVPENFCGVYDWISKSANIEDFLANSFVHMPKEKYQKLNY